MLSAVGWLVGDLALSHLYGRALYALLECGDAGA
jgi:hypothetical protein